MSFRRIILRLLHTRGDPWSAIMRIYENHLGMFLLRRSYGESRYSNDIRTDIYRTDKILCFSPRNIITLVQPLLCLGNSPNTLDVLFRRIFRVIANLHFEEPCFHICFIIDSQRKCSASSQYSYAR